MAMIPLQDSSADDAADLDVSTRIGRLLVSQQQLAEAGRELDALAIRRPGTAAAALGQMMVAFIRQARQRFAETQGAYERLLIASPEAAAAANTLGWVHYKRGE